MNFPVRLWARRMLTASERALRRVTLQLGLLVDEVECGHGRLFRISL